jgi:hypothetical protein
VTVPAPPAAPRASVPCYTMAKDEDASEVPDEDAIHRS